MNPRNGFCGDEIIIYAAVISTIISKDLNANELNILGNFFQAIGQNLEVLSAYLSSNNSCENTNN